MNIKILGPGCAKCVKTVERTKQAVTEMGMDATVEKVDDIYQIMKYGVMVTPAIVIDEKVVSKGQLLSVNEIKELISKTV